MSKENNHTPHNADLFAGLRVLRDIGLRLTPEQPTTYMCDAGMAVSDLDPDTVRRVYYAMLQAAARAPLCGEASLH